MEEFNEILIVLGLGFFALGFFWYRKYGWKRGLIATLIRFAWVLPVVLAIWPRLDKTTVTSSLSLRTIHFLEDDSLSMAKDAREAMAKKLDTLCRKFGCRIQHTKLSDLSGEVEKGYTPLAQGVQAWMPLTHGEPWIVYSDGGDSQPSAQWAPQLKGSGRQNDKTMGLILAADHKEQDNLWIEMTSGPDFGFDLKVVEMEATVFRRSSHLNEELTVQVQASVLDKNLASLNVNFRPNEKEITVRIPLPPLSRGTHLVKLQVLPIANEAALWDNTLYKSIEILPNTIGLLHLLGSPSWDGRFVRRYLKSEPKYDLISFFILRDPSDAQFTNERELSLIPFPVERLFNEELPNFRAVIIQNFSLFQFLEPSYQKNLVDFVLNGGGLLFVGGPRALHDLDVSSSPLAALLPFKTKGRSGDTNGLGFSGGEIGGIPYDKNAKFKIEMAEPSREKRQLATVFDDWAALNLNLRDNGSYQGLHQLDNVELNTESSTPLLMAKREDGKQSLLAAASYPGKGRAIWLFSDDLWRLGMESQTSRDNYQSFMRSAMTWLLREELQRPLWIQDFALSTQGDETVWSARIRGAAARFLEEGDNWHYRLCGIDLPVQKVSRQMLTPDQWIVSGSLSARMASGSVCEMNLEGQHAAFGKVRTSAYGVIPESYKDSEMEGSLHRLEQLGTLSGATLLDSNDSSYALEEWFGKVTGNLASAEKSEQKLMPDYYWVMDTWWGYLLILLIPLEILVRRWDVLVGGRLWEDREKGVTRRSDL
ncbi:MAG: hypothetical protein H7249_17190 [Chitinophagaceae bacterium]|nr:hypothetical protein [Oligoflexus sp.]